jgi:hypothetical protein
VLHSGELGANVFTVFLLNPFLPILVIVAAVLALLLAYVRRQPVLGTVILVEVLAVLLYTCVFFLVIAPVLGIAALAFSVAILSLLWRGNLILKDIPTLLVAGVGCAAVLLLFG